MYGSSAQRRVRASTVYQYPQQSFYLTSPDILIQGPVYSGIGSHGGSHGYGWFQAAVAGAAKLLGIGKGLYDTKMANMTAEEMAAYEQQMAIEKEKERLRRQAQFQENLPFIVGGSLVTILVIASLRSPSSKKSKK